MAVQAKLVNPQPSKLLPSVDKTKKRSISTPPLMLHMYNVGQREGPPQATSVEVDSCGSACQREEPRLDHGRHLRARRSINQQLILVPITLTTLPANHTDDVVHMDETLKTISDLCKDVSQASLKQVFRNMSCARIMHLFEIYLEFLRVGNGSLSTFWLSYLDRVDILRGLLRASREGHWMLHLASIHAVIHW